MRILFFTFLLSTALFSKCNFDLHVNADLQNNSLHVKGVIKDDARSLEADFEHLPIQNKNELFQSLKDGANILKFDYTLKDKETINNEYIMLLNSWLPRTETLCTYDVHVSVPKDMTVVIEANEVKATQKGDTKEWFFKMDKPIDNLTLIAGNGYDVVSKEIDGIEVTTYFFKKHANLANDYFKKMEEMIKEYQNLIGHYP